MTFTKSQFLAYVESLKAAGISGKALFKACKEFADGHEFTDDDGHKMTLSLADAGVEDPEKEPDGDEAQKAMKATIKAAIAESLKGFSAPAPRQPLVEVKTPEDKLMATKNWGFANVGEYAIAIKNSQLGLHQDERIVVLKSADRIIRQKATPATAGTELVGADGGFMVPPDIRQEVWIAVSENESILSLTDMTPTNSNNIIMPADETTPWQSTGGILAAWRAQNTAMTPSKPSLQNRNIVLNEAYALVAATDELLSDAPRLNNYLMVKAPQKMGYIVDESIFRGNGSGQPLGFLNSPSLISSAKTSSAGALTVLELTGMLPRLLATGAGDGVTWFVTPRIIPLMQGLSVGNSAVWLPNQQLEKGTMGTLLGYPVRKSFHCSALNLLGDIVLANMKGYAAYNHTSGMDFQSSIHLYFDAGATAFRWRFRLGGEPYLRAAVTPPQDTTNTVSHFVARTAL